MTERTPLDLLLFNLATDDDDPVLGFTTGWINALARYCASVDVVSMLAGRHDLAGNVRVFSIGKEKGFSEPRRVIEFYRNLFQLLRSKHYDACFCHMTPLFALMAAPLLQPRHIGLTLWYAHKSVPLTLRPAERIANTVITPTPESFPLRSPKLQVVGHGIDTVQFAPAPASPAADRPYTIACVGRIAPSKGIELLIRALGLLAEARGGKDLRVRIVGPTAPRDQSYLHELQDLVTASDLARQITFVGAVPYHAIAHEYQRADLLVSTSQTGSADKVVLKAMACELPVLTSSPAFATVLSPWAEILLARNTDPRTLAMMMDRLIEMPRSERASLGKALRRVVEDHHSLDRLARKLVFEIF